MIIATLLFVVVMITCIYLYRGQQQPASKPKKNRYSTKNTVSAAQEEQMSYEDTDEALGIRVIEKKPESMAPVETVKRNDPPITNKKSCVIALYLMAPENELYSGYELLQALLSAGLRYSKQHIFQRHEHKDGRGRVLFRCASATQPGTFDLTKMGAFSCKGLCFFFDAADIDDPLSTFDCLLETLDQLIDDLGGRVLDDHRTLFTKEHMIQYRERIRSVEQMEVTADLFAE